MKKLSIVAFCGLIVTGFAVAADWPQFRGPDRTGISQETGLLKQWPKEGPPLAWKMTGLGGGYSAPAIANGRIFGMSYRDGNEIVWAPMRRPARNNGRRRLTRPAGTSAVPAAKARVARQRWTATFFTPLAPSANSFA